MPTRFFFRATQTGPTTGGDIYDLSETQGSDSPLGAQVNEDNSFLTTIRWRVFLDGEVVGSSIPTSLNVTAMQGNTEYRWRVNRLDESGNIAESSDWSAIHDTTGIVTETLTAPNTEPYQFLEIEFQSARAGGMPDDNSVTINVSDPDSYIDAEIIEFFPQTVQVNVTSETEAAELITPSTGAVNRSVGIVSETESAELINTSPSFQVSIGTSLEAENTSSITPIPGASSVSVNVAGEIETPQSIVLTFTSDLMGVGTVGIIPVGGSTADLSRDVEVRTAQESESANSIDSDVGTPASISIGTATETENSQGIITSGAITVSIGTVGEAEFIETSVPIPGTITNSIGLVSELESVQSTIPNATVLVTISPVAETETSQSTTSTLTIIITANTVSESESANSIPLEAVGADRSVSVNPVAESETAQSTTVSAGPITAQVNTVTETETAQSVTIISLTSIPLGTVTETESSQSVPVSALGAPQNISVTRALESETSLTVTAILDSTPATISVSTVNELESPQSVTVTSDDIGLAPPFFRTEAGIMRSASGLLRPA